MIENVRKLNTADLFEFMRMVKRTGVKDELKKIAKNIPKKEKQPKLALVENEEGEKTEVVQEKPSQAEVGIDLAFSVMEIFANKKAEDEIYAFIARPFQCKPEEVAENDLMDTIEKLKDVADAQKWASFFKSATQ
ncbi:hypothetical protein [Acetobacterium woodii]|uniref:Uncharacterized protein n=1 Tax=Acetobacterium woodii (strain ATCC 29683 / DSM 1030 / JCM 2381 / KCTC 1655 / WB1) TaxID=931626 RepID=H6LIT6_ACEWD|nr:hypothetical protein [Acetobacterium woodii]AFA49825.1 hypothetical protein Awo_c30970 [Acetobacterium woodii DSM 1030]